MAYQYVALKQEIFTDEGQRMFLAIRDNIQKLLRLAGAVRMQEAIRGVSGDSWRMMACVDRMVELGEIRELTDTDDHVAGQHRIFENARTE